MTKTLNEKHVKKQLIKILFASLLFSFIYLPKTSAQLCQGSLGDPVVDITFGSGANPGPSIGTLTNYSYSRSRLPAGWKLYNCQFYK